MTVDRNKVLLIMARKCLSYEDVAKAYGCSRQRIHNLLDKQQKAYPKTAGKIAAALGVDVTEILAD